jgi:hypothetical protein
MEAASRSRIAETHFPSVHAGDIAESRLIRISKE